MDSIDVKILGRLLNNCRESPAQIGARTGISGSGARYRVMKMIRDKVIEGFSLKVEPPVLGYGVFYIVVTGRDPGAILEQVRLVGEPFMVVPCVGGITVCGIVVKEDASRGVGLAKDLMRDVRVLSIFEAEDPDAGAGLTRTDLGIMNELIKDPRGKIETIAEATGFSRRTVARSIEKMQRNDAIQFTLTYDPTRIGGYIAHAILLQVSGEPSDVLSEIEEGFAESFLQVPFLAKNQIVLFMYSKTIFGMDDLVQEIREVPGVESADLFIPKKMLFPQGWIKEAIRDAIKSPRLHLAYRTGR